MATNTQTPRHKLTIIEGDLILELASVITQTGGGGDMESATYDPQGIEGDAFDMANMTEAADAKVMTAAERSAITALGTASTREADQDLRTTDNVEFAEVTADTVNLHTAAFDTANGGPTALGEVAWDSTDGTLDLMAEGGVKVALGEDGLIRVRNTSGSTIPKGAPLVYLGTNGASTRLNVGPWIGSNVADVRIFLGFAAGEMASNADGYATWFGKIKGITTDGGAENWDYGDILYCVPGVSSTLTNIKPTSGDYVTAAVVINAGSGTSGSLFVRPTFETASSGADQSLNTTDSPTFQSLTLNNGLSSSELLVYGSDDGAGNFTRTSFTHSAGGDLTIATEAGGSGAAGDIILTPTSGSNVGIGTTSPTAKIHVEDLSLNGSAGASGIEAKFETTSTGVTNVSGLRLSVEQKATSGFQANFNGLVSQTILDSSNVTTSNTIGLKGSTYIKKPLNGTGDNFYGLVGDFINGHFPILDSATIAAVASTMTFDFNPTSTNANTKITGFFSSFRNVRAGQLPMYSGFYFENPDGVTTGSITDVYGLYLEEPTIGTSRNFGVYAVGGDNYFGGNVGIGTTTPARKLHVSDAMRLEPTTAPASPAAGDLYFDSSTNKLRCYDGTAWNDLF
jgi:hypothetical protein